MYAKFRVAFAVTILLVLLSLVGGSMMAQQRSIEPLPIAEFVAEGGDVSRMEIAPDGTYLVTMGTYLLNVWDLADPSRLPVKRTVQYPDNVLEDFVLSESGEILAYLVSGDGNAVFFVDPRSGRRIDPRSDPVADSGNSLSDGYWEVDGERIPQNLTAIGLGQPGAAIAVGYALGGVSHLDIDSGRSRFIRAILPRLWDVEFLAPNRMTWAGPEGIVLATTPAGAVVDRRRIENQDAHFVSKYNSWVLQRADGEVSRFEHYAITGEAAFTNAPMQTWTIASREPDLGRVLFPLDDTQRLEVSESGDLDWYGSTGVVGEWHAGSAIDRANEIDVSATALSEGLLSVARGPIVSVYRLPEPGAEGRQ